MRRHTILRWVIIGIGAWAALSTTAVLIIVTIGGKPAERAVVGMGSTLAALWVLTGGSCAWLFRDRIRDTVLAAPLGWKWKFVLFATSLALLEEAITTSLTNLAPLFGVPVGFAYITASANYLEVVCLHSVVVFVPMFIGWAWMLGRHDFSPNEVFFLFGITGALAEASSFGRITEAGFWIFIYGLMVYLPAYSIPRDRNARPPRFWHYPMAALLPFITVIPIAGLVHFLHPVKIHFPPIGSIP